MSVFCTVDFGGQCYYTFILHRYTKSSHPNVKTSGGTCLVGLQVLLMTLVLNHPIWTHRSITATCRPSLTFILLLNLG